MGRAPDCGGDKHKGYKIIFSINCAKIEFESADSLGISAADLILFFFFLALTVALQAWQYAPDWDISILFMPFIYFTALYRWLLGILMAS